MDAGASVRAWGRLLQVETRRGCRWLRPACRAPGEEEGRVPGPDPLFQKRCSLGLPYRDFSRGYAITWAPQAPGLPLGSQVAYFREENSSSLYRPSHCLPLSAPSALEQACPSRLWASPGPTLLSETLVHRNLLLPLKELLAAVY